MTRINLLPWREALKKQRTTEFYVILAVTAALAAAVWYGGRWYIDDLVSHQEHRNQMLETEIAQLERQIEEIDQLETVRDQLLARMSVIEELQAGRPQVVHLFEEVATTIPEGVYLEQLRQRGDRLTVSGVAQSNARVSTYMENLDMSPWLTDPDLDVIEVDDRQGSRVSRFTLRADQTDPNRDGEGAE